MGPRAATDHHHVLSVLAAMPTVTPTIAALAVELGRTLDATTRAVRLLERVDLVETFDDPHQLGQRRVLISVRGMEALGLKLAIRGDVWTTLSEVPFSPESIWSQARERRQPRGPGNRRRAP